MSEMDLTVAESKANYEEIKEYVLGHTGLKVSNLYIAQIKQKCGIIERANYNVPKSENSRQPKCPSEKEKAIRGASAHVIRRNSERKNFEEDLLSITRFYTIRKI